MFQSEDSEEDQGAIITSITPSSETTKQLPCEIIQSSDIGYFVGTRVSDHSKVMLLEKPWTPSSNYQFPYNEVVKKGKTTKKYAQRSHLERFHWLVLSDKDKGLYCKYCVLFTTGSGCGYNKNTPLRKLVKEPLKKFDDLLGERGDLIQHEKNQYHIDAVDAGKKFLSSYHNPAIDIANKINSQRMAQIEENKKRLIPIIKTILLCGRQNIPLRGHRDDKNIEGEGVLNTDTEHSIVNDGNFRELLRFRIDAGDIDLRNHLQSAPSNATYISKHTQNELIRCCKEEIQATILARVKEAQFFSIIFDETTDISCISQLSLSVRYVHEYNLKEEFITFVNAYEMIREEDIVSERGERRLTGIALGHIVEDLAKNFDLDLKYCVGFGVDSCSVMASETKGAIQELKKTALNAQRCPCNNHILNNSLANSSKVVSCRNASGTMKKIVAFANASPKRHDVFKRELGAAVQSICDTRWVERHEGHLQFQGESIIKMHNALEEISTWQDRKTSSDAFALMQAIRSPDFLISVVCLSDVLGVTVGLSRLLQTPTLDLKKGTEAIQDTLNVLQEKREQAESIFNDLFSEVREVSDQLEVELKIPRLASSQTCRQNHPAQSCIEYFRRSVYLPLLDHVITDLKERLSSDVMNLFQLRIVLPKTEITTDDTLAMKNLVQTYKDLLGPSSIATANQELMLWSQKWKRIKDNKGTLPDSVLKALESCDIDMYPTIHKLLRILATLPVSAATAERSFSTLRRLKTWLRSNMGEDRLTGLALMSVHRELQLDPDAIILRFAKTKRRQEFVL